MIVPEAAAQEKQKDKRSASIVFTGDIGFDRYMAGRYRDRDLLAPEVRAFLGGADHVCANVEGPLIAIPANTVTEGAAQLKHSMEPAVADFLQGIGADIWNLVNNHIMDAGPEGVAATLRDASTRGIRTIGAGMDILEARRPVILQEAGGIGLFGVGYRRACREAGPDKAGCFSWNDMDGILEVIREIKRTCRWCVAVVHGGEEFTALPTPYTRDRYLRYLEMGADLVVCHHPHVPMNYEIRGEKAIFYSLGNFIFDTVYQRAQFNTEKGVLLKLCFTETHWSFEPMGLRIDRETERVLPAALPKIFRDVPEEEYRLLVPLAAKMFIANTKRQQTFLNPGRFLGADDAVWKAHFEEPMRSGRVPGEALDFFVICPLAEEARDGAWKKSTLEDVKAFILEQMDGGPADADREEGP
ncbi:MAG: CapA family protein [Lachnospiraceae bacterium]|nr:CapA family protein [Lachnospiraceae bacterium]